MMIMLIKYINKACNIVEELDKAINETERALFVSQQQSDLYKQVQQKIQVLRQQCQLLLNELDSAQ